MFQPPHRALAGVLILLAGSVSLPLAAEKYEIDGVHSTIVFKVTHLGVSPFYGRFNDISGSFVLDEENPAGSSFEVEIKAGSVDTGAERRDQHVKSPDFLNAKQFPVIALKSKSIKKIGERTYQATGELSLHGVTKTITVDVEYVGSTDHPRFGYRSGFGAAFSFKRSDFGMDFMLDGISDEVRIMVGIEGKRG